MLLQDCISVYSTLLLFILVSVLNCALITLPESIIVYFNPDFFQFLNRLLQLNILIFGLIWLIVIVGIKTAIAILAATYIYLTANCRAYYTLPLLPALPFDSGATANRILAIFDPLGLPADGVATPSLTVGLSRWRWHAYLGVEGVCASRRLHAIIRVTPEVLIVIRVPSTAPLLLAVKLASAHVLLARVHRVNAIWLLCFLGSIKLIILVPRIVELTVFSGSRGSHSEVLGVRGRQRASFLGSRFGVVPTGRHAGIMIPILHF